MVKYRQRECIAKFKKTIYLCIISILIIPDSQICAQKNLWPDTPVNALSINDFEYLNRKNNLYNELLKYHDPLLYVCPFPHFNPVKKRSIELQNGEGKKGYWLEGQLSHRFVLYKGKYYKKTFLRKIRVTLDVGFLLRMTRDSSSPLLPTNNDVGLGADYLISNINNIENLKKPKVWIKAQIHHYSNGQSNPFYFNSTIKRNNYSNGDFSTNYFQAVLHAAKKTKSGNLTTLAAGYQRELNIGKPLIFSPELIYSYGRNRLLLNFQWIQEPVYKVISKDNISSFIIRRQFGYRTEFQYILDNNLSRYPYNKKYRTGWHNYFYYMPWVTNEVGFIFHTYIGRDYLNIRFDDIITTFQLGIIVKPNR
jgi:hypothetical protein